MVAPTRTGVRSPGAAWVYYRPTLPTVPVRRRVNLNKPDERQDKDMNTTPTKYVADMIRASHLCGLTPLLLAAPGVGKSALARIAAALCGCTRYHKINPVGKGPQEVIGYGIPDASTGVMRFSCPEDLPTWDEPTLFNIDELPNAGDEVIAEFHGIFDADGEGARIGTHRLGARVLPVITGNQRKHSTSVRVLSAPMVTRCVTILVEPDLDFWMDWANGGSSASPVLGTFPTPADIILGESDHAKFLKFSTHAQEVERHWSPAPVTPWDGVPYPTPRGHEGACRATHPDFEYRDNPQIMQLLLQGILGPNTGPASYAFSQTLAEHIDTAKDVLAGRATLPTAKQAEFCTAVAAHRLTRNQSRVAESPTYFAMSGGLNPYIERVLIPSSGEVRDYLVDLGGRDPHLSLSSDARVKAWMTA